MGSFATFAIVQVSVTVLLILLTGAAIRSWLEQPDSQGRFAMMLLAASATASFVCIGILRTLGHLLG
jgi:uncharacterized membrane protein YdjX (TVP38/TMEM64 family)